MEQSALKGLGAPIQSVCMGDPVPTRKAILKRIFIQNNETCQESLSLDAQNFLGNMSNSLRDRISLLRLSNSRC